MRLLVKIFVIGGLFAALSCGGQEVPDTPLQAFKTYTRAVKAKDTTTMKMLLSNESLKMHEQEAKAQGVNVDDIVKRESLFNADQTTVEFRNEKVDGDKASIEVKDTFGIWITVPFIREDGVWKIDLKGEADEILDQQQHSDKKLDELINQGRQP